ncbi:hypothetical protein [Pseudarthrobacter raffinosi]|uniref:hypothetical protein n=1 Tax=Pseudarthrobacter raffinosi TaxID=2953651 RepID=UPI00208E1E04|nr:hypothetical protein [Pseudarthrobacter sp. MDT3-28]MCO4239824.1 hypothetical protein [Pseudarthrobacter sp. MDT3-28]
MSENQTVVDLLAVLDEPGGVIDKYIESFQLEHINISNEIQRTSDPLLNAQRYNELVANRYGDKNVVRLMTAEHNDVPVEALALVSLPKIRTVVFTRNYTVSSFKNVTVQGIPVDPKVNFDAKVGGHISRIIREQPAGSPINPPSLPFPTNHRSYAAIAKYVPVPDERHTVSIDVNGVKYDFLSDLRTGTRKLFVFGQSALNRSLVQLPVFHRWKWMLDLEGSAIALNDPTLYLDKRIDAGWWIGTKDRDYVKEVSRIVGAIAASLNLRSEDVIFYGGSAGGFSSFHMAACLPGSRVVADIPQIDLRKYHLPLAIDAAVRAGLGCSSRLEVPQEYLHRIDVIERFKHEKHVPDFLYLQNLKDGTHVQTHFGDFQSRLEALRDLHEWAQSSGVYETYSAWSVVRGGHFPLGRFDTMRYLNNY